MIHLNRFNESNTKDDLEDVILMITDEYSKREDIDIEIVEKSDRSFVTFTLAQPESINDINTYDFLFEIESIRFDIIRMLKPAVRILTSIGYKWEIKVTEYSIFLEIYAK